jgi:hypothetical protein
MNILVQYEFRPQPGSNFINLIESVKVVAALWRKYGAEPSLWSVSVGEAGNLSFTVPFATFAEYGKCMDALSADPDFRLWQTQNSDAGNGQWIRSNLYRHMSI